MRASRARSGAWGPPASARVGCGAKPHQTMQGCGGSNPPFRTTWGPSASGLARKARTCAPRGRGAGLGGPGGVPAWGVGRSPTRRCKAVGVQIPPFAPRGAHQRQDSPARRARARLAGAERGLGAPASARVGCGAKPHQTMQGCGGSNPPFRTTWGPSASGLARKARTCAPRGRGAGLGGPGECPRGVWGEAPPDDARLWGFKSPLSHHVGPISVRTRRQGAHVRASRARCGAWGPRRVPAWGVGRSPTRRCKAVGVQIPPFAPRTSRNFP